MYFVILINSHLTTPDSRIAEGTLLKRREDAGSVTEIHSLATER